MSATFEIIAKLCEELASIDFSGRYQLLLSKKKKLEKDIEEAMTLYRSTMDEFRTELDDLSHLTRVVDTCTSIKGRLAKIQASWNDLDWGLKCAKGIEIFKHTLISAARYIFPGHSADFYEQLFNTFRNIGEIILKGAKLIDVDRELDAEKAKLKKCQKDVIKQLVKIGNIKRTRMIVHAWKAITCKTYLDEFKKETKHRFKTSTAANLPRSIPEARRKLPCQLAQDIHKRLCRGEKIKHIVCVYENANPVNGIRVRLTQKFVRKLHDLNKLQ